MHTLISLKPVSPVVQVSSFSSVTQSDSFTLDKYRKQLTRLEERKKKTIKSQVRNWGAVGAICAAGLTEYAFLGSAYSMTGLGWTAWGFRTKSALLESLEHRTLNKLDDIALIEKYLEKNKEFKE